MALRMLSSVFCRFSKNIFDVIITTFTNFKILSNYSRSDLSHQTAAESSRAQANALTSASTTAPATAPTPVTPAQPPREYQPAAINHLRNERREATKRKNLATFFTSFDQNIKKLYNEKNFDWPADTPTASAELAERWKFEDAPPAKKQKTDPDPPKAEDLDVDDTCVICMERPRTHAFLHYGLAKQDVSSHFIACQECANTCRWADQGCPCCRAPVINIIRVLKWISTVCTLGCHASPFLKKWENLLVLFISSKRLENFWWSQNPNQKFGLIYDTLGRR